MVLPVLPARIITLLGGRVAPPVRWLRHLLYFMPAWLARLRPACRPADGLSSAPLPDKWLRYAAPACTLPSAPLRGAAGAAAMAATGARGSAPQRLGRDARAGIPTRFRIHPFLYRKRHVFMLSVCCVP